MPSDARLGVVTGVLLTLVLAIALVANPHQRENFNDKLSRLNETIFVPIQQFLQAPASAGRRSPD